MDALVVLTIADQRYALQAAIVDRIVRSVQVTPLPRAPQPTLGVINVQGKVVPVIDMRERLGQPARDFSPSSVMVIARSSRRTVALLADSVEDVCEYPAGVVPIDDVFPGVPYVRGVIKLPGGLVLIHDIETFLSLEEQTMLDHALAAGGAR